MQMFKGLIMTLAIIFVFVGIIAVFAVALIFAIKIILKVIKEIVDGESEDKE